MRGKILKVSAEWIIGACKKGIRRVEVVSDALPDDAELYAIERSPLNSGDVNLVIISDTFPNVPTGANLDVMKPTQFQVFSLSEEEIDLIKAHRRLKGSLDSEIGKGL